MMQDWMKMEGVKELVKITKICKEVNYIEQSEMDEKVRQLLVEEKKGKRSSCDRSYFRKMVKEKKWNNVKELLVKGDEVERNADIWKLFIVSLILLNFCWSSFCVLIMGGKLLVCRIEYWLQMGENLEYWTVWKFSVVTVDVNKQVQMIQLLAKLIRY